MQTFARPFKAERRWVRILCPRWRINRAEHGVSDCKSNSVFLHGFLVAFPLSEEGIVFHLQGSVVWKSCFLPGCYLSGQSVQLTIDLALQSCRPRLFLKVVGQSSTHGSNIPASNAKSWTVRFFFLCVPGAWLTICLLSAQFYSN